jgi:hypothetical protein
MDTMRYPTESVLRFTSITLDESFFMEIGLCLLLVLCGRTTLILRSFSQIKIIDYRDISSNADVVQGKNFTFCSCKGYLLSRPLPKAYIMQWKRFLTTPSDL